MKRSVSVAVLVLTALAVGVVVSACGEEQSPPTGGSQLQAAPVDASAVPPDAAPAGGTTPSIYSPEALETLLAPIALYPDPVLAQVLASSTNPQEVLDAGNWLVANPELTGKELESAAAALGFTPPMLALIQFPTVVDMMCMEMDWTTELGTAFQADEPGVLAAVQRLRKQAEDMGNLESSAQMKVTNEERNNQQVIVVQPANPEVVYVPQYNPAVVYSTPAPAAATTTTTTTNTSDDGYSGGELAATGLLAFGAGILVNELFDDHDDDYYAPRWGYGYGGPPYYPPPYRPRYGNGYRPANGYRRPPNYQHGFNNNNIYVNNGGDRYFDRFGSGRNNYRKNPASPISAARPNRPELGELNQRAQTDNRAAKPAQLDKGKVQGSYAGARPGATATASGFAQQSARAVKAPTGSYAGANPAVRQKMDPRTTGARDRGRSDVAAAKPAARTQSLPRSSAPAIKPRQASSGSAGAFNGIRNSGASERAASQRGRSSMSGGARRPGGGASSRGRGGRR